MTFEDFFAKKKIDLAQFQRARPDLYQEFRQHYALMGEKSFDHTKKYWFNRLRKEFQLTTEEVTDGKTDEPNPNKSVRTDKVDAKAIPAGFKPRFKAGTARAKTDEEPTQPQEKNDNVESTSTSAAEQPQPPAKPLGFKPRFKAGTTAPAKTDEEPAQPREKNDTAEPTSTPAAEQSQPPAKPLGFKPRYKPGITGFKKGDSSSS
ncbi:hypothetical protein SAMN05421747_1012 [Parapedobacter composti]|uniref:Uncharacterized protein n=1 Tax=Parapedobacter composti TaxID=623281 RepID=A0A1I1DXB9_9SPHI|nr:hypothetical protein [Parapedobacter composti]SFB77223.1 hypothetical protein SAMN05421747_1012 [Parapedobacter composti]